MTRTTDDCYERIDDLESENHALRHQVAGLKGSRAPAVYDVKGNLMAPPVVVRTPDATSYRVDYDLGDIVYLRVRDEPIKGQIVGITIQPTGVVYTVRWGAPNVQDTHFAIELHDQPEL